MSPETPKNRRFPFTKTRLETLAIPETGRVVYHDSRAPGLVLRITSNGKRSLWHYRRAFGDVYWCQVGSFPAVSIEQARNQVHKWNGDIANGIDPRQERRQARQEPTLGEVFAHWCLYAEGHKKPVSAKEDRRLWAQFLSGWANRKLSAIHKADVQGLHAKVGKDSGVYSANRMLSLLRAMVNKADDLGYRGANPAAQVTRFKEQPRDRFLSAEELAAFFAALELETELYRDYFTLALLTGARRENVRAMAWNELDFEHGLWRMPETKAGCPVVVPLVPAAVNILHNRRAAASDSPYVFPGRNGRGHLMEIYGAWRRILKRAKIADRCTPHDLRRTLGSWQAMNGASLLTIGKSLGHTSTTATAIYSRLTLAPVRDSMNKAVDAMKKSELAEQVCGGIDNGNLLYRPQRLPELVARGMVVNVRGVGFYRPDAPPPGAIELG